MASILLIPIVIRHKREGQMVVPQQLTDSPIITILHSIINNHKIIAIKINHQVSNLLNYPLMEMALLK
jgi:hypothetical protein